MGWEKKWEKPLRLSDCLTIDRKLKPLIGEFINDYEIKVINVAWLTDEQIAMFSSDFKILAKQLQSLRLGKGAVFGDDEITHMYEILGLLGALTGDDTYSNMQLLTKPETKARKGENTMDSIYKITLQKAKEEAKEENTRDLAFRMKESGMQLNDIAKITRRSTETLKKWFEASSSAVQSV